MATEINPIIPPLDGVSRIEITSVIRNGDHAPHLIFTGVIEPKAVTAMVLDQGAIRHHNLAVVGSHLMKKLARHLDVALGPPKDRPKEG